MVKSDSDSDKILDFVSALTGDKYLKVEEELGNGFVRLKISEAERRQARQDIQSTEDIIIELLRNSRDAEAKSILIATSKTKNGNRKMVVLDDGCGIPEEINESIFDARVTSKLENMIIDDYGLHGRGMALFSIKERVGKAVLICSNQGQGSVISIEADTQKIKEIKDQSTWPVAVQSTDGYLKLKGPRNIIWHAANFNLQNPKINIYIGSPSQILATIVYISHIKPSQKQQKMPLWYQIGRIDDIHELTEASRRFLDLDISERNIARILNGEIKPLPFLLEKIDMGKVGLANQKKINFMEGSNRNSNISKLITKEDLANLSENNKNWLNEIGKKYFLSVVKNPKVAKKGHKIYITIELDKDD